MPALIGASGNGQAISSSSGNPLEQRHKLEEKLLIVGEIPPSLFPLGNEVSYEAAFSRYQLTTISYVSPGAGKHTSHTNPRHNHCCRSQQAKAHLTLSQISLAVDVFIVDLRWYRLITHRHLLTASLLF
jgi:hypothetical protein